MIVINLWGGPGAGKTTTASGLFSILRHKWSVNLELITEFATDLCFEQARENLKDQVYLLGNQYHRLWRAQRVGVEVVITDAPIGLNKIYGQLYKQKYMDEMGALCQALDAEHKNLHILMHRDPKAQGGFKGGSKRKDSWFVDRFDELLKTHGPQFDRQCHYTPVAAEELARYLCIIYPEHVKAGS
ncbi:MAG: AAA family ATPase [Planctomycetota bacterium]|jgi:hypothetical protein